MRAAVPFAVAAALWAHMAIAAPPPGCDSPVPVSEYATDYRCPGGVRAVTSDARPANVPDGHGGWREPVLAWARAVDGFELATLPGPLVYRAAGGWLVIANRAGGELGRIGWHITAARGADAHFTWHGLPCRLTAQRDGLKLACDVAEHLGQATLSVETRGAWAIDAARSAVAGAFAMPAPVLVAGEVDYHNLAHWRVGADTLEIVLDDRLVPVPYVLDPNFGPNFAGTGATATGVGTVAWSNPGNIASNNSTYATASLTASAQSNWLKATNFGFTTTPLSDDKVIKGIVVESDVKQSGGTIRITDIRAVKAGTIQTTSRATGSCITNWTNSDSVRSCGSSSDLWGTTWTPADVRDSGFGAALSALNTNASTTRTASVDYVQITIYYSPPSGRVYLTGWDTWFGEDGTATTAGSSTITYPAGAKRTGNAGLRITTAANSAANWCVSLDSDLTNKAYVRAYIANANPIPAGSSMVLGYAKDDGGTVGCYAVLSRDGAGHYAVQTRFHGNETSDLNFGTYPIDRADLAGLAITWGQVIEASGVACPLYFDGSLVQGISLQMAGDCSGGACDLNAICLGTPATSAVDDYAAIPVATLDLDDLVVDNLTAPTVGKVQPLFPDAAPVIGGDANWTNSAGCSGFNCLTDWSTWTASKPDNGASDWCLNSGGDSQNRQRGAGAATDLFQVGELPALAATDSVKAMRFVGALCSKTTNGAVATHLYAKQCASDSNCTGAATATGTDYTPGVEEQFFLYSPTYAEDLTNTGTAWTESAINALHLGAEKTGTGREVRQSALLAYAEVANAIPPPDKNLQDWNHDGQRTGLFGCDSITAGTNSSICADPCVTSADCTHTATCFGGYCVELCSTDANCDTGGICSGGRCQYSCSRSEDCFAGAVCLTAIMWVNQFSSRAAQFDNIINCGRTTMPLKSWWTDKVLPDVLDNPYSHSIDSGGGPCTLVRGAWGYCSGTTTQSCASNADCPTLQTCVANKPDYVLDLCGFNDFYGPVIPGECGSAHGGVFAALAFPHTRWKQRSCPMAAATPTGYQVQRTTCTNDSQCVAALGAGSICAGYCDGHQDPVWPCESDIHCGECADDATVPCYHQGSCLASGVLTSEGCDTDADCAGGGPCLSYAQLTGKWDAGTWGVQCSSCTYRNCVTATKYCTPTCAGISCATDADCAAPGGIGGLCDAGTGKCRACGVSLHYTGTRDGAAQLLLAKRVAQSPADVRPEQFVTKQRAATALVEAAGARRISGTYALTGQTGTSYDFNDLIVGMDKSMLRQLEYVVDLHNAIKFAEDRYQNGGAGYVLIDGFHNHLAGAGAVGDMWASYMELLYPVCSTDQTKACGFCDETCTADADCTKPTPIPTVIGTSPTPTPAATYTPRTGACRTATPGAKVCGCAVDGDCAAGQTCVDVDAGAGTDKRCIAYEISRCPAGDGIGGRKLTASDAVCSAASAGTCSDERTLPMCTRSKVACRTTADCLGYAQGDVCADSGAWIECDGAWDCRSTQGVYPRDVCAPGTPVVGTSPTPRSLVCQQPTPTP